MKQDLQRIEAALHLMGQTSQTPAPPQPDSVSGAERASLPDPNLLSFLIPADPGDQTVTEDFPPAPTTGLPPVPDLVANPPAGSGKEMKSLLLPRVRKPGFTSHRNAANPALAMNLLKELEAIVAGWQQQLHQVLRQLQDLYLEGPILNGWLESYGCQEGTAPAFRHAEVDCLMNYVEKLVQTSDVTSEPSVGVSDSVSPVGTAAGAGYRLCGMNEDGQLWFRHCPSEQVPEVSLAIVRYQKLQGLLEQKDELEQRLSNLAETLIGLHAQMKSET